VYEFLVPAKQDTSPLHFINPITSDEEWKFIRTSSTQSALLSCPRWR